jgi:hypothetical protein
MNCINDLYICVAVEFNGYCYADDFDVAIPDEYKVCQNSCKISYPDVKINNENVPKKFTFEDILEMRNHRLCPDCYLKLHPDTYPPYLPGIKTAINSRKYS